MKCGHAMKRFSICALAISCAAAVHGEWIVGWEATYGFLHRDGSALFSAGFGAATAQLIWSPTLPATSQAEAGWVAGPGGAVNAASSHVILTNKLIFATNLFSYPNGSFGFEYYTNSSLPSAGYVFARVFDAGSDDPNNLDAFSRYFESRLVSAVAATSFDVNAGAYGIFNFPAAYAYRINVQTEPGRSYQLQYASNLKASPPRWLDCGAPVLAATGLTTLSDTNATDRARYYRVRGGGQIVTSPQPVLLGQ